MRLFIRYTRQKQVLGNLIYMVYDTEDGGILVSSTKPDFVEVDSNAATFTYKNLHYKIGSRSHSSGKIVGVYDRTRDSQLNLMANHVAALCRSVEETFQVH